MASHLISGLEFVPGVCSVPGASDDSICFRRDSSQESTLVGGIREDVVAV